MNTKTILLNNKYKVITFILGYLLIVTDIEIVNELTIILSELSDVTVIILNLLFIGFSIHSFFILKKAYLKDDYFKTKSKVRNIIDAFIVTSIGAYVGAICAIGQSFVKTVFSGMV